MTHLEVIVMHSISKMMRRVALPLSRQAVPGSAEP